MKQISTANLSGSERERERGLVKRFGQKVWSKGLVKRVGLKGLKKHMAN